MPAPQPRNARRGARVFRGAPLLRLEALVFSPKPQAFASAPFRLVVIILARTQQWWGELQQQGGRKKTFLVEWSGHPKWLLVTVQVSFMKEFLLPFNIVCATDRRVYFSRSAPFIFTAPPTSQQK